MIMTSDWRQEAFLVSNEAVIAYLNAAFEQGDAALIAVAIHDVVKAQGIDNVAAKAGMPQSELQKVLRTGNLRLSVLLVIMKAIGVNLSIVADAADSSA